VAIAAAALLILLSAAATAWILAPASTPAISAGTVTVPTNAPANVGILIADYEGLSERLLAEFTRLRHRLPPDAVAAVEDNLEVIDEALAEIWLVLEDEPNNEALLRVLTATYRQKVSVLEHATESVS